jgi:hypothetical protein
MKIASQNRTRPRLLICGVTVGLPGGGAAEPRLGVESGWFFPVTPSPSLCFGMPSGKPIAEGTKRLTCSQRVR